MAAAIRRRVRDHIVNGRSPDTRKRKIHADGVASGFSAFAVSPRLIQKDHVVQIIR